MFLGSMNDIDDYIVVCNEDLQKVIDKVNDLIQNYWYELSGNLFVVRTDYKLNIVLTASGSISWCWESPWWSYTGNNTGVGNPTWKNIYHQVLVHHYNNNAAKYKENEQHEADPQLGTVW